MANGGGLSRCHRRLEEEEEEEEEEDEEDEEEEEDEDDDWNVRLDGVAGNGKRRSKKPRTQIV